MPYLYVLNGRLRHKVFHVAENGEELILGQRDDAQGHITDPWISWSHAKVRQEEGLVTIEDMGSTNGTYVNCERITRRSLNDDDVIFLGRTHVLYVASDRPPSAPPPIAQRMAQQSALLGAEEPSAGWVGRGFSPPGQEPPGESSAGRHQSTQRVRMKLPGSRQELPALEMSQESSLLESVAGGRPQAGDKPPPGALATGRVIGPFTDAGQLEELFADADDDLQLPPTAELAPSSRYAGAYDTARSGPLPPFDDELIPGELSEVESLEHYLAGPQSDDHIEIDIEELGLGPPARGDSRGARSSSGDDSTGESTEQDLRRRVDDERAGRHAPAREGETPSRPTRLKAPDAAAETDPIGTRDSEIEHLQRQLALRDAEIGRLRAELTNLREQYLDL